MNANAKHTCGGPVFGKLTSGCPRCDELAAGAKPVQWHKRNERAELLAFRRDMDAAIAKAKREGGVCTFGEW